MEFDGFDWDSGNSRKCQKHGVLIYEIESIFIDGPSIEPDIENSEEEARFRAVGITNRKRYLFIVFTFRQKNKLLLVRPISARYMHKKEIKSYEKAIS